MEDKTNTYECVCCEYTTKVKCNYDRHMKSVSHLKIETGKPDTIREDKDEYIIRLQKELEEAINQNKVLCEFYEKKIKELKNEQESIKIKKKPKEIIPENNTKEIPENNVFIKQPSMEFRFL